jgi:NAD(P)-dependent dehydrogenase (short-subunit alcohol dehydrogenase family)
VVVVTGSGRGIGREMACTFACLGAMVVIAELSELGEGVQDEIRENGGDAAFFQVDISDEKSVAAMAQKVLQRFGPVSILVNNAILSPVASVLEMPVSEWDRVMAVNLRGAFLTCRAFLPGMITRGFGTILNLISTEAMPFLSAYIASKQGLAAFSQSLAAEVGDLGVRVIAFGPGFVDTPGLRSTAEGLAPHLGMSPSEFIAMPMHAAYPGAMPAEDAAAAAGYLVVKLRDEFHGETVTGYTILERAGYLPGGEGSPLDTDPTHRVGNISRTAIKGGEQMINLALQIGQVLDDTEAEFAKLPVFVRPLAKSGFNGKAGMSLGEWKQFNTSLVEDLQANNTYESKYLTDIVDKLGKLERYYLEVPKETARFVKDPQALQAVVDITQLRVDLIQKLKAALINSQEINA